DYRNHKLALGNTVLRNATAKVIKYRGDSSFNYQFLLDYFIPETKDTTARQGWDIKFGDMVLDNVSLVYRNEKYVKAPGSNINYNDIWLQHTYGRVSDFRLDADTVHANIKGLRTREKSGFVLDQLDTKASISDQRLLCENVYIKTSRSRIKGKIDFAYKS